jgi:hypothetical protein
VDEITARAAVEPYEVLEHAEHHLLFEHQRAQQIASAADDRSDARRSREISTPPFLTLETQ